MIAIIHTGNTEKEPYFEKYLRALKESGAEYELIMWDRMGNSIEDGANKHVFRKRLDNKKKGFLKISAFRKYCRFVQERVAECGYDRLILLTTMSAFALGDLIEQYKGRYFLDIRDMSYEKVPFFKKRLRRIIENSAITSISSDGFRDVLPDFEYVKSHNFTYTDLGKEIKRRQKMTPIKVIYVGRSRGFKFNMRLVRAFGGDERFDLHIAGEGADSKTLRKKVKRYSNIKTTGRYEKEQKSELLRSADMLINMNLGSFNGKRLTSNKFYDGLIYKLPQITREDEYMGTLVSVCGVGIALDVNDPGLADKVYSYYKGLNMEKFRARAESELEKIKKEDEIFIQRLKEFMI